MPRYPLRINHVRQDHQTAGIKVLVRVRFLYRIKHRPIIRHLERIVSGREIDETVAEIAAIGKAVRIEIRFEGPIARERKDVAGTVDSGSRASSPKSAVSAIG